MLRELLAEVPGVREAYIYGSWARRHLGESGNEPADIDVVVISDAEDRVATVRRARAAADEATGRLGRDVSASVLTPTAWSEGRTGFIRSVRESPLVSIDLSDAR